MKINGMPMIFTDSQQLSHWNELGFCDSDVMTDDIWIDPGNLVSVTNPDPDDFFTCGMEPNLQCAPNNLRMLCLTLTHACNLRCAYCFVPKEPAFMTVDTAQKAIDQMPPQTQRIDFFGGEPLLCMPLLVSVVSYAQDKFGANNISFGVTTNGTLIDPTMANYFKENNFSVIISIDGPKRLHDLYRMTVDKRRTFDLAMAGLHNLIDAAVSPITVRGTFAKDNLTGKFCVQERLEFLNQMDVASVALEPVGLTEGCNNTADNIGLTLEDNNQLYEEYLEAFEWMWLMAKSGKRVKWSIVNTLLRRLVKQKLSLCECGAGKGIITVAPNGDIYPCHREPGKPIGHVETGIMEKELAAWHDNRYYVRKPCYKCPIRNFCGGGCRSDSVITMGDIHKAWPVYCMHMHVLFYLCYQTTQQLTAAEIQYLI